MDFNSLKDLKGSLDKKGNTNIIFLEDDKTHRLRLIPNAEAKDTQFTKVWLHYRGGGVVPETMFSPKNWSEPDPIEDFVRVYLSQGRVSKAKYKQLKNMEPSEAFITKAVVRGKESEGTKLLVLSSGQFNQIYSELEVAISEDPTINVVHPTKGYDLIVNVLSKEKSETGMRNFKFKLARNSSPLADTKEVMSTLINEQPSWESAYKRPSVEDLERYHKSMAQMSTELSDVEEDDDDDNDVKDFTVENYSASTQNDLDEDDLTSEFEEFMKEKAQPVAEGLDPEDDNDDLPF
jgi:hypothetical protein